MASSHVHADVYVACSEGTTSDDSTDEVGAKSSRREATFYGDSNQSVIEMPFQHFLEHYSRCTGLGDECHQNSTYLSTGLNLYLMQSCIRSGMPSTEGSSEVLLPELADYVKL
jgi:hypothetical protein